MSAAEDQEGYEHHSNGKERVREGTHGVRKGTANFHSGDGEIWMDMSAHVEDSLPQTGSGKRGFQLHPTITLCLNETKQVMGTTASYHAADHER